MRFRTPVLITAWMLSFTILISSIGVAQVTHICKLALAGMEKQSCSAETGASHACCSKPEARQQQEKKDECCSNNIKVFRQTVVSTIQSTAKILPVEAAVISLFSNLVSFSFNHPVESKIISFEAPPPFPDGEAHIMNCIFRI